MDRWLFPTLFILCCLLHNSSAAQSFRGTVLDSETLRPLAYASIGVKGKSIGVIADRLGQFNIDISHTGSDDSIIISYAGYEPAKLLVKEFALNQFNEIKLQPVGKLLKEVIILAKKDLITIGNAGYSSRFTGWGDYNSSRGRMRGLKIESKEFPLKITQFGVRFHDNEFDSVKLRLHIQSIQSGASERELINENIFFTALKDQRWVYVDLEEYQLVVDSPVIVTVEWLDAWAPPKTSGGGYLFTFSLAKKKGVVYQRNTSQESYLVKASNETPSIHLKGYKIKKKEN
jgi:hypothetical protein